MRSCPSLIRDVLTKKTDVLLDFVQITFPPPLPPLKFFEKIFAGVGKTSLAVRFIHGTFQEMYSKTIEDTYRYISVLENQYNVTLTLALFQKTLRGSQSKSVK